MQAYGLKAKKAQSLEVTVPFFMASANGVVAGSE